ncbi:MAG: molybdenum transporter, periplasmic molybdate-binding protein [Actinomycetia bacterium]|jgi:molybdate transport system substrate-binding protein|nr:molybdenum transporter, periplasmic molybdate-binding protein [Actinomycetes bacterium]
MAPVKAHLLHLLIVLSIATTVPSATSAQTGDSGRLTVFAAASLTDVFPKIDALPRYGFAGSDQLSFQIQQGAPADVFAAASPKYPELLYKQGLVEKPVQFATNTLVLIVPTSNPAGIRTVDDLTKPGVKLVVGDPSVPVGSYTRTVLGNLGIAAAALKNVVSQETDVRDVLGKVGLGEADAGFVYLTDAKAVKGKVKVIAIRESAQPHVVYEAAVVKGSPRVGAAYRFLTRLLRPTAQRVLERAGFGPRPKP